MALGNIANPAMVDTVSVIGTTIFSPAPIGGVLKPVEKILTSSGTNAAVNPDTGEAIAEPIQIMDVAQSGGTHPSVPGSNPVPPFIPTPAAIQRPTIVAVRNTRVFFGGDLVTIAGDGLSTAPPTTPPIRSIVSNPLTGPSLYPNIIIGTNPI
jgi:hypothetical protein